MVIRIEEPEQVNIRIRIAALAMGINKPVAIAGVIWGFNLSIEFPYHLERFGLAQIETDQRFLLASFSQKLRRIKD